MWRSSVRSVREAFTSRGAFTLRTAEKCASATFTCSNALPLEMRDCAQLCAMRVLGYEVIFMLFKLVAGNRTACADTGHAATSEASWV